MKTPTKEEIIDLFHMQPLLGEGGQWCQTYVSDEILPKSVIPGRSGDRPVGTGILFLITKDTYSRMHRLTSDETFHFYFGAAVEMVQLAPDGTGKKIRMGHDILNGEKVQVTVPRGVWQGTRLVGDNDYALLGTTMCPGFDQSDYTNGYYDELAKQYPAFAEELKFLCGEAKYE